MSQSASPAIFFKFGDRDLTAVYLGNGRYAFEWAGHRMIAEPHIAQSFIDWLLRTQDLGCPCVGTPEQDDCPHA